MLLQAARAADEHGKLRRPQRNLIPVPGRDIMIQGWYQAAWSLFDFTDPRM